MGIPRTFADLLVRVIVVLIAMDIHEFAHAYVAYRMGDTTARDMGRMTLNPFVNINWLGFAMWVFIGFGILGSAPVNEYRMRDRRWGMFYAVLAGPVANLILAAIAAIPFRLGLQYTSDGTVIPTLGQFLYAMVFWNAILFLFNLLPFFPLDGWTVLIKLLPADLSYKLARYQQESMYLLFGLILLSFVGFDFFGLVIVPPFNFLMHALIGR